MYGCSCEPNYAFTFAKADNPYDMIINVCGGNKEIIRPCGLSPMKSKGIHGLSHILIDKHGKVPQSFEF
jgi:endonuclease-3